MTQIEQARKGIETSQMKEVAKEEKISIDELIENIAKGKVVIPANPNHHGLKPIGIGEGLRTKINANIGTSMDFPKVESELEKLSVALESGADTVMDLSTGGNLNITRKKILKASWKPVGTVPIYQAAIIAVSRRSSIVNMKPEDYLMFWKCAVRMGSIV